MIKFIRVIALISCPAITWAESSYNEHNEQITKIINEYRAECREGVNALLISGEEINTITSIQGEITTIVLGSFECEGEGHLWCGSGGCHVDVVVGDKRFEPMLLLHEPPTTVSYENGVLSLRKGGFEWSNR